MSNISRFTLLILIGGLSPMEPAHGQHYHELPIASQYVPVWQQIGIANPWHRKPAFPIWPVYNSYSTLSQSSFQYRCDRCLGLSGLGDVNANEEVSPMNAPARGNDLSTAIFVVPPIGDESEIPDSLLQSTPAADDDMARPVDDGAIGIETRIDQPAPIAAKSELETAEGNADGQPSPSDMDLELRNRNNDDGFGKRIDADAEEMKQVLVGKEAEIADLTAKVDRLKGVLERSILEEINRQRTSDQPDNDGEMKKLIEQAVNEAKKEAAWEISQLRKKSERATEEARRIRARADAERSKLLARLKAVEAKLKKAQPSQSGIPNTEKQ